MNRYSYIIGGSVKHARAGPGAATERDNRMPKTVSREKIPWFPTVDPGRCTGCRVCLDFCSYGVYGWDEELGIAAVRRPYECIVGCNGCEDRCPAGAITFPDPVAVRAVIRKLKEESD
jgi:NAD-dependent dihydropyrimidine dehydrogenase PreA subunit